MKTYIVLYRIETIMAPADIPFNFLCKANDGDHAEEQCINAYPNCDVVWVSETDDPQRALADFWIAGLCHE